MWADQYDYHVLSASPYENTPVFFAKVVQKAFILCHLHYIITVLLHLF